MDNFDLAAVLRQYREEHGFSQDEMGKLLNMSRSAYARLESGEVRPPYDKALEILKKLNIETPAQEVEVIYLAPERSFRQKIWRWLAPIVISVIYLNAISQTAGFIDGYGGAEAMKNRPPSVALIFLGALFCALYWYYFPPEWPFKKKG